MAPDERQWTLEGETRDVDSDGCSLNVETITRAHGPYVAPGERVEVVPRGSEFERAIRALRESAEVDQTYRFAADFLARLKGDGGKER